MFNMFGRRDNDFWSIPIDGTLYTPMCLCTREDTEWENDERQIVGWALIQCWKIYKMSLMFKRLIWLSGCSSAWFAGWCCFLGLHLPVPNFSDLVILWWMKIPSQAAHSCLVHLGLNHSVWGCIMLYNYPKFIKFSGCIGCDGRIPFSFWCNCLNHPSPYSFAHTQGPRDPGTQGPMSHAVPRAASQDRSHFFQMEMAFQDRRRLLPRWIWWLFGGPKFNKKHHPMVTRCHYQGSVLPRPKNHGGLFFFFRRRFWIVFGFLVLCFPVSLIFCFSASLLFCFSAFLLFLLLCFLLALLLCFLLFLSLLFCFFVFRASLLLYFCAFLLLLFCFFFSSVMCFCCSTSCSFASLLPVVTVSVFFILFCYILFCLYPKWNPRETLGETQRNPKEILIRNPTWSPKWTLKKP